MASRLSRLRIVAVVALLLLLAAGLIGVFLEERSGADSADDVLEARDEPRDAGDRERSKRRSAKKPKPASADTLERSAEEPQEETSETDVDESSGPGSDPVVGVVRGIVSWKHQPLGGVLVQSSWGIARTNSRGMFEIKAPGQLGVLPATLALTLRDDAYHETQEEVTTDGRVASIQLTPSTLVSGRVLNAPVGTTVYLVPWSREDSIALRDMAVCDTVVSDEDFSMHVPKQALERLKGDAVLIAASALNQVISQPFDLGVGEHLSLDLVFKAIGEIRVQVVTRSGQQRSEIPVLLKTAGDSQFEAQSLLTDETGTCVFKGLKAGAYQLRLGTDTQDHLGQREATVHYASIPKQIVLERDSDIQEVSFDLVLLSTLTLAVQVGGASPSQMDLLLPKRNSDPDGLVQRERIRLSLNGTARVVVHGLSKGVYELDVRGQGRTYDLRPRFTVDIAVPGSGEDVVYERDFDVFRVSGRVALATGTSNALPPGTKLLFQTPMSWEPTELKLSPDGSFVQAGQGEGRYWLLAVAEGYASKIVRFKLEGDEEFELLLEPASAVSVSLKAGGEGTQQKPYSFQLSINSRGFSFRHRIEDLKSGETRAKAFHLPPGIYTVRSEEWTSNLKYSFDHQLVIERGKPSVIHVTVQERAKIAVYLEGVPGTNDWLVEYALIDASGNRTKPGTLVFTQSSSGLAKESWGIVKLPVGSFMFEFKIQGYKPMKAEVVLEAGKETVVRFKPEKVSGS